MGRTASLTEKPKHGHDLPWTSGKHLHFHQETLLILSPTHLSSSSLSVLPLFFSLSCSLTPLLCADPSSLFLIPSPLFLHLLSCPVLSLLTCLYLSSQSLPPPLSRLSSSSSPSSPALSFLFVLILFLCPDLPSLFHPSPLSSPPPLSCPPPFSIPSSSSALTLLYAFLFPQPFHLPVSCLC